MVILESLKYQKMENKKSKKKINHAEANNSAEIYLIKLVAHNTQ